MSNNSELSLKNWAVLNISQVIKTVMTSTAEAEIWAMPINAREIAPAPKKLQEMGHKQPQTLMQMYISEEHAIVT